MKTSEPRPVRDTLNRTDSELGKLTASVQKIQSYNSLLDTVVEMPLRSHITVANVRDGQLVLLADSPAWASRLRLITPQLQQAISQDTANAGLTGIQIITRPRLDAPKPNSARRARISETTRKLLNEVAEHMDDPRLRRALKNIARRNP